jgi:hypothetical protein
MPADIVTRQIDITTNMLATPFCPREDVGSEFFISGTDPVTECTVHMGSTLYPDTSGIGGYPPTSAGSTYVSPGQVQPVDTSRATMVVPGRVGRPQIDSSPRRRDTTIYGVPRRDSAFRPDTVRRVDSALLRRLDSLRRPRPDTPRVRPPDTPFVRLRPDTTSTR